GPGRHHYHAPCRGPGRHHYPRREPGSIPTPEPKPISPVPLERIDGACVLTVALGTKAQRFGVELARLSLSPVRVKTRSLLSKPHVRLRREQTWIAPRQVSLLYICKMPRGSVEAAKLLTELLRERIFWGGVECGDRNFQSCGPDDRAGSRPRFQSAGRCLATSPLQLTSCAYPTLTRAGRAHNHMT